jgi:hypothetical protein
MRNPDIRLSKSRVFPAAMPTVKTRPPILRQRCALRRLGAQRFVQNRDSVRKNGEKYFYFVVLRRCASVSALRNSASK